MVSMHDLRSPAVALDWHEAVAVAAALAARIVEGRAAGDHAPACPHPEDVELLPSGTLRVTGPRHFGATPAQGAALVLGQLLESAPCPAELRQLVEAFADDAADPAEDGPAALLARLAFYERPGRTEVLAALATRAEPLVERARRTAALEALTERTRHAVAEPAPRGLGALLTGGPTTGPAEAAGRPPSPEATASEWAPPQTPTRWLAPAGLALLAFVAAASAASWWLAPAAAPAVSARQEEDLPIEGPGPAARTQAAGSDAAPARPSGASSASTPQSPAGATPPIEPARPPAVPAPVPVPSAPASTPAPRSTRQVDVVVAERDGRVVPPGEAPDRSAPRATPGRVFSDTDPRVTPAVLIRPHLPAQPPPDVPEEQIGTLEFVVSESGAVEHVRLISPANRFQERMLVAAAKTWQFRPAMRDGRPVRYRTRIRLTL